MSSDVNVERRKVGRTTWTTALISAFIAACFSGLLSFFSFYMTQAATLQEVRIKLNERTKDMVTGEKLEDMADYFSLSITATDDKVLEARARVAELATQVDSERLARRELEVKVQRIQKDLDRIVDN